VHPCSFIWTPNVTFVNHHILWVCHAPSWTNAPKLNVPLHRPMHPNKPMHSSTFTSLGTNTPQPWVCSSCRRTPTSLVCPFSWLLLPHALPHAWEIPLGPTSVILGCRSSPEFCLLEDLGEGLHTLLAKDLTTIIIHTSCETSFILEG
jgi:hypothetical protein